MLAAYLLLDNILPAHDFFGSLQWHMYLLLRILELEFFVGSACEGLEECFAHGGVIHFGMLVLIELHLDIALIVGLQFVHVVYVLGLEILREVLAVVVQIEQPQQSSERTRHKAVDGHPELQVSCDGVVHGERGADDRRGRHQERPRYRQGVHRPQAVGRGQVQAEVALL